MSQPSAIIPNSSIEVNTIAADLNSLRESLEAQVPYTGGIHVVKPEDLVIYYDVDGEMYPRSVLGLDFFFLNQTDAVAVPGASTSETREKKIFSVWQQLAIRQLSG
jgi:hypothetical protein